MFEAQPKPYIDMVRQNHQISPQVKRAMDTIPRHWFALEECRNDADYNLVLRYLNNQTISEPLLVGYMLSALQITTEDQVLEIGTGSGYSTILLAALAKEVVTIDRDDEIALQAKNNIAAAAYGLAEINPFCRLAPVTFASGDGSVGYRPDSNRSRNFDKIIVWAGAPDMPIPLFHQLSNKGKIVIPLISPREPESQDLSTCILIRFDKLSNEIDDLGSVQFVPLVGEYGITPQQYQQYLNKSR